MLRTAPTIRHEGAGSLALMLAGVTLVAVSPVLTEGMLSRHMLVHIALMGALAPAIAISPARHRLARLLPADSLWLATIVQIIAFFAWHTPAGMGFAGGSAFTKSLMQGSLFLVSVWFWIAVVKDMEARRWRVIAALLLTGKLFCLLAALYVFSPRFLYAAAHMAHADPVSLMDDQQLAGLLMLTGCPLTYVAACVLITIRWTLPMAGSEPRGPA